MLPGQISMVRIWGYPSMDDRLLIRPTETDLLSEAYDRPSEAPSSKSLIVCSAPRSGSNEFCRLLLAGGIGVPFEYFNRLFVAALSSRWDVSGSEPNNIDIKAYIDALRRKRSANGVLAIKLQYPQFEDFLRNRPGETLFEDAVVVHLYRSDAVAQFESFYVANETGRWDYTESQTTLPRELSNLTPVQLRDLMEDVLMEDAKLRVLFVMLGIRPLFLSMDDLFAQPKAAIARVAQALGASVNEERLDEALAASKRYSHADRKATFADDIRDIFKPIVFRH